MPNRQTCNTKRHMSLTCYRFTSLPAAKKEFWPYLQTLLITKLKSILNPCARSLDIELLVNISALLNDVLVLTNSFVGYCFCLIKKDANFVAYELSICFFSKFINFVTVHSFLMLWTQWRLRHWEKSRYETLFSNLKSIKLLLSLRCTNDVVQVNIDILTN